MSTDYVAYRQGLEQGLDVLMGGGPASIYATHAVEAIKQFSPIPAEIP